MCFIAYKCKFRKHRSFDEITTSYAEDSYVPNSERSLRSAEVFPKLPLRFYQILFQDRYEWNQFIQQHYRIPPKEYWKSESISPLKIRFDRAFPESAVFLTLIFESTNKNFQMIIKQVNRIIITVYGIKTWECAMNLIDDMLYCTE